MGQKINLFVYYKDFLFVILLPIIFLPLPLAIQTPEALCGYLLLLMGGYWCTEALPLGVTSMMPVFLVPLFGFMTAKEVCPLYFKEINMMLTGGLIVALAIEKCNLHRRIALKVLLLIGVSPRWLMLGFMVPTWFLSMWISNTATSAMMMPIVIEVIHQMDAVKVNDTQKLTKLEINNKAYENGDVPHCKDIVDGGSDENANIHKERENVAVIEVNSQTDVMSQLENHGSMYDLAEEADEATPVSPKNASSISKGLVISIAYSANCGGTGTLIGTGVNLVLKGMADDLWQERFGTDSPVNFTTWIGWGFPISLLNVMVVWFWLQMFFVGPREFFGCGKKRDKAKEKAMRAIIVREYEKLGPVSVAEIQVGILFFILVMLWFFRQPDFIPGWAELFKEGYIADAVPAILIGVLCFALPSSYTMHPSKGEKPSYLMDWGMMTQKFPWSVILLLGGGFALAEATTISGLSDWIGAMLTALNFLPDWALVMILTYLVTLVTQFTSNTATASLMLPIVRSMALKLHMNPLYLMLPIVVATQLAFMLPVATPPNAVAFTAGVLEVMDMVKAGAILNILCTLVVTLATHTWGMAIFDLSNSPFVTVNNGTINATTVMSAVLY